MQRNSAKHVHSFHCCVVCTSHNHAVFLFRSFLLTIFECRAISATTASPQLCMWAWSGSLRAPEKACCLASFHFRGFFPPGRSCCVSSRFASARRAFFGAPLRLSHAILAVSSRIPFHYFAPSCQYTDLSPPVSLLHISPSFFRFRFAFV